MKKTLFAAALLASAVTVSAQPSITLFGVVDARVAIGRGSLADAVQLTSAGLNTSRLGFRGSEDLGGGLAASFWLEAALSNDSGAGGPTNTNNQASGAGTGSSGSQGLTFARRSTVSLTGRNWGELRLGREYVPQYLNLLFDPFGNVGVGVPLTLSSIITGVTSTRASNGVAYFLPAGLGGFYGTARYYLGENSRDGAATEDDGNGGGVRIGYASGPLDMAVATGRTEYASGDTRQTNIGGSWNFKVAKVFLVIGRDRRGALRGRSWEVAGVVPLGRGEFKLALSDYSTDAAGNPESKKVALGYVQHLSKRTALYTTWARVENSGGAAASLNGSSTAANASSSGLDLGIRHSF
ncbi:porin [Ramlibacter sp. RBP-2]|uniref:Porin n=2 Tax=Ramlibacter lithotrophicus TaxID=2606681 RepID=A0A7X6DID4_9BURK|nr:porin [Ramlibacter lithotrophicus]NKE67593.1 porin [Ramlibacter lithotrophicus]